MAEQLNDWDERPLERHKPDGPLSRHQNGTWSVCTANDQRDIELTREDSEGYEVYLWVTEAELLSMLEALRPPDAPVIVYGLLADRRIKQLEQALNGIRLYQARTGNDDLLRGSWKQIKEARG